MLITSTLRSYQHHRDGGPVRVSGFVADKFARKKSTYEPLDPRWIAGLDTESHKARDGEEESLVLSLVTLSFHDEQQDIDLRKRTIVYRDPETAEIRREEPLPRGTAAPELRAFEAVLTQLFARDGWAIPHDAKPSVSAQRKKVTRTERAKRKSGSRTGRDGRRMKVPARVLVMHNLPYDVTRLFAEQGFLRRLYAGATSFRRWVSDRFEVECVRYVDKGAAQFLWYVREYDPANKRASGQRPLRIARLRGFDTFNYMKRSLRAAAKSLDLPVSKIDIGKDFFSRSLSSFTDAEWTEFREYAARDAKLARLVYLAIVHLLGMLGASVINREGLIPPSLPAASASMAFAKAFELHPSIQAWSRLSARHDQLGTLAYHGARVFCAEPGVFSGLVSLDLKSAYPAAMTLLPDPVTVQAVDVERSQGFDVDRWRGRWGVLWVDGESLDPVYPAFPQRGEDGSLRWHVGPFECVPVTIPELVIGVVSGALRIDAIRGGVELVGSPDRSFLRAFVLDMYAVKEAEKERNPPLSELAKTAMNSTYGKLVQVDSADTSWSEGLPIEEPSLGPSQRGRCARSVVTILANDEGVPLDTLWFGDDGDPRGPKARALFAANESRKAHRSAEERVTCEASRYLDVLCGVYGSTKRLIPLYQFLREAKTYRPGSYFMPLYAAQITGLVSATLGSMARETKALAGDTDAVLIRCPTGRAEDVPGYARHFEVMARAGYTAPREGGDVIGDERGPTTLGRWAVEMAPSTESILVGRKRYSHAYAGPKGTAYKQAHHGIANVAKTDDEPGVLARGAGLHELLRVMLEKGRATYRTKKSPRKGREAARSGLTPGVFVSREVTAKDEPLLYAERGADGIVRWQRSMLRMSLDRSSGFWLPTFDPNPAEHDELRSAAE